MILRKELCDCWQPVEAEEEEEEEDNGGRLTRIESSNEETDEDRESPPSKNSKAIEFGEISTCFSNCR